MLTKQERRTQKTVLAQRDAARAETETLRAEVTRLQGDVRVLAAEEINRAETERDKANAEREALLRDFNRAVTEAAGETGRELEATKTKLVSAQREVQKLVMRNAAQTEELASQRAVIDGHKEVVAKLDAELGTLKMEDAKQLRKRLQAKTERVAELERELAKRPASTPGTASAGMLKVPGLSELLVSKLRRKLQEDGQKAVVLEGDNKATVIGGEKDVVVEVAAAPEPEHESTMFGRGNASNPPPASHIP